MNSSGDWIRDNCIIAVIQVVNDSGKFKAFGLFLYCPNDEPGDEYSVPGTRLQYLDEGRFPKMDGDSYPCFGLPISLGVYKCTVEHTFVSDYRTLRYGKSTDKVNDEFWFTVSSAERILEFGENK